MEDSGSLVVRVCLLDQCEFGLGQGHVPLRREYHDVPSIERLVLHRHTEETGDAKRLDHQAILLADRFRCAAKPFHPVVETGPDLVLGGGALLGHWGDVFRADPDKQSAEVLVLHHRLMCLLVDKCQTARMAPL